MELQDLDTTLVCLGTDGRLFKLPLKATEVMVNEDAVLAGLRDGQRLRLRDMLLINRQPVGLMVKADKTEYVQVHATIPMPELVFNTNFVIKDEVLNPVFAKPNPGLPLFNVKWDARLACSGKVKIWLLVQVGHESGDGLHHIQDCYLAATSSSNRVYRLPLGNIYDTGKVCMGQFERSHGTLVEALQAAFDQFTASPWNSDLVKSTEKINKFFRFKAANDGFETLPVDGQWNNLCERISSPELDFLCLPPPEGGAE